jgi:hypothetical protein
MRISRVVRSSWRQRTRRGYFDTGRGSIPGKCCGAAKQNLPNGATRVEIQPAETSCYWDINEESAMKVMVFVKATQDSEAGTPPTPALLEAMGKYNQELIKAGVLLAADGLKPSAQGKRVRFSGEQRTVIDGPFTETKELVAGYWLWQVKSIDEAVEWLKRCPNPMLTDSDVDIRPVYEMEDFRNDMQSRGG